jgi:hypothetical protein
MRLYVYTYNMELLIAYDFITSSFFYIYKQTYIHTYIHTYTHTYIHIHIYILIYIHTSSTHNKETTGSAGDPFWFRFFKL